MMLVDALINLVSKGYYSTKNLMDLNLEEESDFYIVKIIGAVQVFRDETKKEQILTLFRVRDYKTGMFDPEKEKQQQIQLDYLSQERSVIDMYHHLKDDLLDQGFIHLTNEELAQGLFNRYKIRMPEIRMIKQGIGQWIHLPKGRDFILEMFLKKESELKAKLKEIMSIISNI